MKTIIATAAALAAFAAAPATAAQYDFSFDTVSVLLNSGPFQTGRGVFTTSDVATEVDGQTAYAITGISGTINDVAISGLFAAPGDPTYYYFTSGPTFLNGSGVRFNAGAASNISFFAQSGVTVDPYRVGGNGTILAYVNASSSAVAAVPETATWGMMILGFGVIGGAMRQRRRATTVRFA